MPLGYAYELAPDTSKCEQSSGNMEKIQKKTKIDIF